MVRFFPHMSGKNHGVQIHLKQDIFDNPPKPRLHVVKFSLAQDPAEQRLALFSFDLATDPLTPPG